MSVWIPEGQMNRYDLYSKALKEKCQAQYVYVYMSFVDLTKASDTVIRQAFRKLPSI